MGLGAKADAGVAVEVGVAVVLRVVGVGDLYEMSQWRVDVHSAAELAAVV